MITLALLAALITPPTGYTGGADRALVEQNGKLGHFGGIHGVIEAESYTSPAPSNIVLYVVRVAANTADPNAAAGAELEALHPSKESGIVERSFQQTTDHDAQIATLTWGDPIAHTRGSARLVLAATGDRIVSIKGECVASETADIAACEKALASLDTGIAAADRIALAPTAAPPPAPTPTSTLAPATLSDGTRVPLPPMSIKPEKPPADRRPVYIGLGLVALAAIFWWNRRRRERFEAEDRGEQHE